MSGVSQEHDKSSIEALIAGHEPGHALDQRFYTDPAIYELELEKIISRNWFLAGHVSELAAPGDFKVLDQGLRERLPPSRFARLPGAERQYPQVRLPLSRLDL